MDWDLGIDIQETKGKVRLFCSVLANILYPPEINSFCLPTISKYLLCIRQDIRQHKEGENINQDLSLKRMTMLQCSNAQKELAKRGTKL